MGHHEAVASPPVPEQATYREVFAVREFRALFGAQLLSVIGDQFARVALAVLVFERTSSAALTALTYALTFLPDLLGGPLLSGLADRYPRRSVMVSCDVLRAALVAVMAIPGTPLWVLGVLLFFLELGAAPFNAARAATLPSVLEGDRYVLGSAVSNLTYQAALLLGFGTGGALVAQVGTSEVLLADAVTFLLSGALIRFGVRARPTAPTGNDGSVWTDPFTRVATGARLVWRDRRLRALLAFGCLGSFYGVKEGLAVPYADELGGGPAVAGMLLAAAPAGTTVGMLVLGRWVRPDVRLRLLGPLAVLASGALVGCALRPGLAVTVALFTFSGLAAAYQLTANAAFVQSIPDASRGQAFGLAVTALRVGQGLAVLAAGVAAEATGPAPVIATAGALGVLAAIAAARALARATSPAVTHSRTAGPRDGLIRQARGS